MYNNYNLLSHIWAWLGDQIIRNTISIVVDNLRPHSLTNFLFPFSFLFFLFPFCFPGFIPSKRLKSSFLNSLNQRWCVLLFFPKKWCHVIFSKLKNGHWYLVRPFFKFGKNEVNTVRMREQSVDKFYMKHLMLYEFRKHNIIISAVYSGALSNKTRQRWFKLFKYIYIYSTRK